MAPKNLTLMSSPPLNDVFSAQCIPPLVPLARVDDHTRIRSRSGRKPSPRSPQRMNSIIPSMETPVNTARVAGAPFSGPGTRSRSRWRWRRSRRSRSSPAATSSGAARRSPWRCCCAAAVWVWFLRRSSRPPVLLPGRAGRVRRVRGVDRPLGPLVVRPGPQLGRLRPRGVLPGRGRRPRAHVGARRCSSGPSPTATSRWPPPSASTRSSARGCPDVVTHAHTYARLDSPVGYWNVLALMMVMGLCVALALAGDRATGAAAAHARRRRRRADVLHLLLHVLARRLDRPRRGARRCTSPSRRRAWPASSRWRSWSRRSRSCSGGCAASRRCSRETTDDALRTLQGDVLLRWALAALLVTAGVAAGGRRCCTAPCPGRAGRRSSAGRSCSRSSRGRGVGGSGRYLQSRGGVAVGQGPAARAGHRRGHGRRRQRARAGWSR